ncbi:hypothetical protein [Nitrococcus mobilis]|uniref:Uncharacterized protein n=1 Tax=Nitrococcus mobilis Nb-231 TaxID=314278 RepID=A4BNK8_9GAMM|nr:hypothetical protein [Nitrococcus mobilis]EAR22807.1 hypothetical protein NB231_10153 [Nitrococcus mobilis Nb-231]
MSLLLDDLPKNSGLDQLATHHARNRKEVACRPLGPLFQPMNADRLIKDNVAHIGSAGVSEGNHDCGFRPAFRNLETGCAVLARFKNGAPAPMHLLDGLPDEWVLERDAADRVVSVKPSVIAGFLRQGRFYTREQAAAAAAAEADD